MTLAEIQGLFGESVRIEAFRRFGADPGRFEELEGSAPVYRCAAAGREIALKIAPGYAPGHGQVAGSTVEQVGGEMDFVLALAAAGVPVAAPVPSASGAYVEVVEAGGAGAEEAAFLATATEFLPGELLPDDDVMRFPEGLVRAWGRAVGMLHRVSEGFAPAPGRRRLSWLESDLLDEAWFEGGDGRLARERGRLLEAAAALPSGPPSFGLCHGDPHHGNFMWHGGRLTLFDFDAARYAPYVDDLQAALYNCLPMPREDVEGRRRFALDFIEDFAEGYRAERPLPRGELGRLPLLLKLGELTSYAYCRKYWVGGELTPRRRDIIAGYERRLAEGVPVVAFREGDL